MINGGNAKGGGLEGATAGNQPFADGHNSIKKRFFLQLHGSVTSATKSKFTVNGAQ